MGRAGGDPADERQAHLLAHGVHELDAARSARYERNDAFACQRAAVFFGGVRRFEAEFVGDFRPRGRHAGFVNGALDEAQDFGLARSEVGHGGFL